MKPVLKPVQYFAIGAKPLRQNMDAAWEEIDYVQNVFCVPNLKL